MLTPESPWLKLLAKLASVSFAKDHPYIVLASSYIIISTLKDLFQIRLIFGPSQPLPEIRRITHDGNVSKPSPLLLVVEPVEGNYRNYRDQNSSRCSNQRLLGHAL